MCVRLSSLESFTDSEAGGPEAVMNRLRIGIAIGIKNGFGDVCECNQSKCIMPSGAESHIGNDRLLLQCVTIFFGEGEMIRIFEDSTKDRYYVLVKDTFGGLKGHYLTQDQCDDIIQEVMNTKFGSDAVMLKNLAALQLLDDICKVAH